MVVLSCELIGNMEIHVIGLPESFKKIKSESEIPTLRLWLLSISSRINFYFARVLSHIRSMWGGVVELYPRVLIFKNLFFWTLRDSSKKKKFWKRRNKKTFTHIMNISSFKSEAFARCMNDFDIDSSAVASFCLYLHLLILASLQSELESRRDYYFFIEAHISHLPALCNLLLALRFMTLISDCYY